MRSQCIDEKGKLKRIRTAEYSEVRSVCTWIKQVRNNNIQINRTMIIGNAQELASKLHNNNGTFRLV